jgi:hypothetical protein
MVYALPSGQLPAAHAPPRPVFECSCSQDVANVAIAAVRALRGAFFTTILLLKMVTM